MRFGLPPSVYELGFATVDYAPSVAYDFADLIAPTVELASPLEAARAGGHVYGMLAERGEGNDLQRQLVGGGEHHVRRGSVVVGAQPVRGSHTPAIPRHQAGKTKPGHGRREVIANAALMLKELGGNHTTDGVAAVVLGPAGTAPVSIEARKGVRATGLQFPAQDVAVNHPCSIAHQRHDQRQPVFEVPRCAVLRVLGATSRVRVMACAFWFDSYPQLRDARGCRFP